MYKFEKKIKAAEEKGIRFSEGQQTYIRCARINGIDLSVFARLPKSSA